MTNYYRGSKAPVKAQKADAENRSGTYRGVKHDGQGNEPRKMNTVYIVVLSGSKATKGPRALFFWRICNDSPSRFLL